ncbi:hypothetical protein GCK32_018669, partial [Trichostrongylus colubriformis]
DIPSSHWAYSDQQFNHKPVTGSVIMAMDGYVDVPVVAKYSVLCTFGNPSELRTRKDNSIACDKAARFHRGTGKCYCLIPESDCKHKDTVIYDRYPLGLACLSCESYAEQRSVVFMVSSGAFVQERGWRQQLKFITELLRHVENVRTAVVVIGCPSYVDLPMDTYKPDELR